MMAPHFPIFSLWEWNATLQCSDTCACPPPPLFTPCSLLLPLMHDWVSAPAVTSPPSIPTIHLHPQVWEWGVCLL